MKPRHESDNMDAVQPPDFQFDEIAFLYDELMAGVPYRGWVEYLARLLKHFEHKPMTVLDLCCGTGTVSHMMAKIGYQVTGVDISAGMIESARAKNDKKSPDVDFHVQDAASMRLGKKFDLVISLFDSLNYIIEASDLQNAFYRVADHLVDGGMFVFDMNTELALAGRFFDQSNVGHGARVTYDWRSTYNRDTEICTVNMDFVYRSGGEERQVRIMHYQRAYHQAEIVDMLERSGLTVLGVFDGYTLKNASARSDRVFYAARK